MSEDMDLTALVQEYIVSEEKELRELKERLSDVPVSFSPFEEYLKEHKCFLDDLNIRAKFFDPQMRILLLDDMFEFEYGKVEFNSGFAFVCFQIIIQDFGNDFTASFQQVLFFLFIRHSG